VGMMLMKLISTWVRLADEPLAIALGDRSSARTLAVTLHVFNSTSLVVRGDFSLFGEAANVVKMAEVANSTLNNITR
jgi:hypothetical protein